MPHQHKKDFSRMLRRRTTDVEKALWSMLRGKGVGFKFRRQSPILRWFADFYCPLKRLVVEVDGGYHNVRKDKDEVRDSAMQARGITVLRFANEDVMQSPWEVARRIRTTCEELPTFSALDNLDLLR